MIELPSKNIYLNTIQRKPRRFRSKAENNISSIHFPAHSFNTKSLKKFINLKIIILFSTKNDRRPNLRDRDRQRHWSSESRSLRPRTALSHPGHDHPDKF
jgi:hypothetical protein